MGVVAPRPLCFRPAPGAATRFHWSAALPFSPQLTSPKQRVGLSRAREAGPRGWGRGQGVASAEAGAAAALASGSGLQRSILAAAARAAAPGQVKRDCVSRWRSVSPLVLPDRRLPAPPPGLQGSLK